MVKRLSTLTLFAALAMLAGSGKEPVRADDILDQIQNQVSGIVKTNTAGIVTIEDLRFIEMDDSWRQSMQNHRRGLRHQLTDSLNRLSDADIQVAVLKSAVRSGAVLAEAIKARSAIAAELESLKAELVKNNDVARINVDVYSGHLASLTAKRSHLEAEIAQLGKTYSPTSAKMAPLQATRTAMNSQINDAQSILATYQQKLASDASMRTDIPKAGTGFCVSQGYIVTTADVLDGMSDPIVITTGGARIRTTIVGVDNETNVGLLRLNALENQIPVLRLASTGSVHVGDFAISIGNQLGSQNAASLNTVSGIRSDGMFSGRRFYPTLLQIAGTIAAGNSGAPLLDTHGEVIGMVVAVPVTDFGPTTQSYFSTPPSPGGPQPGGQQPGGPHGPIDDHRGPPRMDFPVGNFLRSTVTNAGYAVPIGAMRYVVTDFCSGKAAQHCWIGISVSAQIKTAYNEKTLDLIRTVTVNGIFPELPALKAGVQKGDQIITINGRPIKEDVDVRIESMLARPGDPIEIVLIRTTGQKSETMTLHATAELRPTSFPKPIQTATKSP